MPPLNHEVFDPKHNPELQKSIRDRELTIGFEMVTTIELVRRAGERQLSGLKGALHYHRTIDTPSAYYQTEEVSGNHKIRAWLRYERGKKSGKETYALYTEVVKYTTFDEGHTFETPVSDPIKRLSVTGSIAGGYDLATQDINHRTAPASSYLQWLNDTAETVGLISSVIHDSTPEETAASNH